MEDRVSVPAIIFACRLDVMLVCTTHDEVLGSDNSQG